MADFRQIKCGMWREDDWFLDLPTDGKLLWVYLFSNPSASVAGIYRISLRTMANETGLTVQRVEELLQQFSLANKAHFSDGILWVVKMREHQSTSSGKVITRIEKDIDLIPKSNPVYHMYAARYGMHTVSIPIHTDTDTDTYTDTDTEQRGYVPAPPIESSASGARYTRKMEELNAQVPAVSRLPLVEKLMDVYGLRALVEAGDNASLQAMHDQAVKLYRMGYTTGESIDTLAGMWRERDWRGKKGDRPRNGQFIEFASQNTATVKPVRKTAQKKTITMPTGEQMEVTVYD